MDQATISQLRRRLGGVATVVVTAAVLAGAPSVAVGADQSVAGAAVDVTPLSADVPIEKQYAADFGVSEEEAARRLALQQPILDAVNKIESAVAPEALSGIWIENGSTYRLVGELVEGSSINVVTEIEAIAGLPIEVRASRTTSLTALTTAIITSTDAWTRQLGAINGIGVDETTGRIVFFVDGTSVARDTLDASMLTDLPAEIVYDSSSSGDHVYGGINLSSCTAGFTARNYSTGTKGYFTAAHCGSQSYQFPFGGAFYASSYLAQRYDGYADIQFRSFSSHTAMGYFYGSSTTSTTAQIAGGYGVTGSYMCHRGKTTGYQCGSVTSITYAPTWSNACNGATCQPVWVRLNAYGLPGDSGGPWFISGNLTAGIHKGGADDGSWAVYAKLEYSPGSTAVCNTSTCP